MSAPPASLDPLLEAGRLLSSQLELPVLLKTVLRLAAEVVGAETASLLLLDEKSQELYFDVTLGLDEKASRLRLKLGEGVAGSVAKDRRPALINDVRAEPRWSPQMDALSGFTTRSILAVPLLFQGRLLGVLEAINKRGGAFGESDSRAFEAFASQAAVALENARLFSSLKEESFKLNTVFSNMADAAVLCDARGAVLLANASARRLMSSGKIPKTIAAALKGFSLEPPLDELLQSNFQTREFLAERAEPKILILAGAITRLQDGGWLCVFRDETETRRREKLKRTFLSLISHKLKTPLCAVIGFAGVLEEELKGGPASGVMLQAAKAVSKESLKLNVLVDKLLRYSTLESAEQPPARKLCAVDELARAAMKELKPWLDDRGARIDYAAAPEARVEGDAEQLREAIKDLIENAVKFDPRTSKTVSLRIETGAAGVVLNVTDSGPGIAPEEQEKVFRLFHQVEAFFTGQVEGLGLGLPYVKKVVEGHGGAVALKSRLGAGTTVSVTLPKAAP